MISTGKLPEETGTDMQMTEICRKWKKQYYKGRVCIAVIMMMTAVGMMGCGKDTGVSGQPEEITTEADKAGVEEKKLPETQKDKDTVEEEPEADQKDQKEPQKEKTEQEEASVRGGRNRPPRAALNRPFSAG